MTCTIEFLWPHRRLFRQNWNQFANLLGWIERPHLLHLPMPGIFSCKYFWLPVPVGEITVCWVVHANFEEGLRSEACWCFVANFLYIQDFWLQGRIRLYFFLNCISRNSKDIFHLFCSHSYLKIKLSWNKNSYKVMIRSARDTLKIQTVHCLN